jgi:zinc protease
MTNIQIFRASALLASFALLGACASAGSRSAAPPELDRSVMPAAAPTPTYDFPDVQRRTLSNGLQLWLVERPGAPIVTMQLITEAGAVSDPADRPGLASLTAAMMTEGTTSRSATQIADELDFLAANLNVGAGQEVALASITTLVRNLEPALAIFADVVVNPSFPAGEWDRVRNQRLVALVQALDQPPTIATREFGRIVYGNAHPYGRPLQGTPESVRSATPEMLRTFHRRHYVPNASHVIVVGDVRRDDIVRQLERAFGSWQRGAAPAPVRPSAPAPQQATRIFLIDKPGSAQSQIRIGHVGVDRASSDYFPLLVMNTILGGQFSSRINLNLREDKGYTYGARSGFEMARLAGPFVAQAGVQTAVTKESVIEFMNELTEIRGDRPVTRDELDFARTSIIRREPLTLETNAQIANRIQDLILYGLPDDYFDEYNQHIAAVSQADVNRVAREYLHPERFAIVIVGDRAQIEDSLRELPYPVELVQVDGPVAPPQRTTGQ